MMTLNPFVENNKARINQFLNNLCEVGDFYDTLEVSCSILPFSASYCSPVADGSIYGSVQERFDDQYHTERIVQHTFTNFATHRDSRQ
jgi:hypothetical protein